MSRLAVNRDTHLSRAEIAVEVLHQFDTRATDPSIRSIAAALLVAPAAIYHHYPSQAEIFQAAVELVWAEAVTATIDLVPEPFKAEPTEVLVAAGVATRRAWLSHHRVARYMAATPESNLFATGALADMTTFFERLGLSGEEAAAAFHTYATFMTGAVLFAAARKTADDQLAAKGRKASRPHTSENTYGAAPRGPAGAAGAAMDEVRDLSTVDPIRDEELFTSGLKHLVVSIASARSRPDHARHTH